MKQEVYFDNIRYKIIESLNFCNKDIQIAVAWITDVQIIKKIQELLGEGIRVSIILYDDHVNKKEVFKNLYYSGANIFLSKKLMHNKFCIIDGKTVINGSYNWTINASTNDENITITYDNENFANQFHDQFIKLSQSCKRIDDFFEYSLSSLKLIEDKFERFYKIKKSFDLPYFMDCNSIEVSDTNKSSRFQFGIYLITNRDEERDFLWILFVLESDYSFNKIIKILNKQITYPKKFGYVYGSKFGNTNNYEFKNETHLVEQHSSSKYVYFIDKKGEIVSDKIYYSDKLPNGNYLANSIYFKTQLIDINLKRYDLDIIISKVNGKIGIIGQRRTNKYGKEYKYGVYDFIGKEIVEFKFDNYEIIENLNQINFIEYPHFFIENKKVNFFDKELKKYKFNTHKVYSYNFINRTISSPNLIISPNDNDTQFIFLSDRDEHIKNLYIAITENRYNLHYLNLSNLSYSLLKVFEKAYKKGTNPNSFLEVYDNYAKQQDQLSRATKTGKYKQKEGCYIATMVYEDYDHPKVKTLRNFRDYNLRKFKVGVHFINTYYHYSPKIVKLSQKSKFLKILFFLIIEIIIKVIKIVYNYQPHRSSKSHNSNKSKVKTKASSL